DSNDYTGGTTINAGTIKAGNDNVLSDGGDLSASGSGTLDLAGNKQVIGELKGDNNNDTTIKLGTDGALTVNKGTYGGQITGAGSLTKTGTDTLTLSGDSNDYTSGTTINAGTIKAGADNVLSDG